MRISEVARAAGCSVRAVRHYHASGALPKPPRTAGGYRDYGLGDLAALLRVRALVDACITLADIRSDSPTLIDAALSRIDSQLAALRAQRSRLLALQAGELGLPADLRSGIRDLLGETAPTGAAAEELIAELRPLTGLVHGVVDTLAPGDVPLGVRDVVTRGAQARALAELAGAL